LGGWHLGKSVFQLIQNYQKNKNKTTIEHAWVRLVK
jgi:hypothetical protein